MARLVDQGGCISSTLSSDWTRLTLPPRDAATPLATDAADPWVPAAIPGTVASAATIPFNFSTDLHALDHWYRLDTALPGGAWLEFGGLATLAEIWIDGALVASSDTMFVPLTVPVSPEGGNRLEICFRALRPALRRRLPGRRPRWRGRLATEEGLRGHRTTLLGHMPGWSGNIPVIGPFRPIILHEPIVGAPVVTRADLRTRLQPDGSGLISLRLSGTGFEGQTGSITAAGQSIALSRNGGEMQAELVIPDPPRWWPHTHGEPATCAVTAEIGGYTIDLEHVGFRTIECRDPAAGFGLEINGTPVFCRGAIWTGLDPSACPSDPVALASSLRIARDTGLNMLRVAGMTVYETPAFLTLCDELGIMVWHDFMLARFDYPDTPEFQARICAEARAFLTMAQAHPCLTVLCGGSEIVQAAAMAGGAPESWHIPLFEQTLAQEAAATCPDIPYVPHAPWPGANNAPGDNLPFAASAAVTHYFGVGAYQRPLHDLSSAGVRFAAECLAFANLPEPASYRESGSNPQAAPRDLGAEWDFADVSDHYTQSLFGIAPATLRRQNPAASMDLGRATIALIMQQAIATWRTNSQCAGALVLMLQDLVPGAGWGIIGNDGRPKSACYALRSVCQPIQVLLRDLGQNGIVLYAINETAAPRNLRLALRGLSPEGAVEPLGHVIFVLDARATRKFAATMIMGRWRDLANSWQFGPPAFTVLGATLDDSDTGTRLSEAVHFPVGPTLPRGNPGLTARLEQAPEAWSLEISTQGFAQFVQIDDDCCVPADNYFHLWPGETRVVALNPLLRRKGPPQGTVSALNAYTSAQYGMAA